nr:hypothetical protein [Escherichia coli]
MATLRELIIKISANSQSFQSEIQRASRMGSEYFSHPPEKYQSVVCNSVLHDEEIQLPFRRPLTTINDR